MAAITRCFLRNLSSSSSPPLVPVQLPSRMETHFWYIVPDEVKSGSLLNQYMELLSPSERENVVSMGGDQLRKRALLARTLINHHLDPQSLTFKRNIHGKPEEAYVKALGKGFSAYPFKNFTIQMKATSRCFDHSNALDSAESEIIVEPPENHEAFQNNWQFALLEVEGSHYASICTEKDPTSETGMKLASWKTIPFVRDKRVSGTDVIMPTAGLIKQL